MDLNMLLIKQNYSFKNLTVLILILHSNINFKKRKKKKKREKVECGFVGGKR